jgi:hypothetical protein
MAELWRMNATEPAALIRDRQVSVRTRTATSPTSWHSCRIAGQGSASG